MKMPLAKRILDLTVSLSLLVLLAPVMALIASLVAATMGFPVFFRQQRPGHNGRPFHVLKFRTMLDSRSAGGEPLSDEMRMTKTGSLLRSLSLDELPQLINVLRGEMSLVGPRPLLMQYLELYNSEEKRRHDVVPGMTGWAQINGRNAISWKERFALDVWYVDNWSFMLDLKILKRTVAIVFQRRGITSRNSVTMPPFERSAKDS